MIFINSNKKSIDEIAREERLAYFKNWRANNKNKVKKHNENYWRKKAEQRLSAEKRESNDR